MLNKSENSFTQVFRPHTDKFTISLDKLRDLVGGITKGNHD